MDGIFLINKERNWTSRDVCNKIQKLFHTKKVGHSGTLDPFAEGLLLVAINKGTKIIPFLEHDNKTYIAKMTFMFQTDTLDIDGNIINNTVSKLPSIEQIQKEINNHFLGEIIQYPPMYSAIHYNGKRLYELAREGKKIEINPRKVFINYFDILDYDNGILTFKIKVSNGTYIRSIARDLAINLSCFGSLLELKRISIGNFSIENSKRIDEIKETDLKTINDSLSSFSKYIIKNENHIKDGKRITLDFTKYGKEVYICNENNEPLAIYEHTSNNIYKSKRGLF